jgi:hypothetical protein
VNHFQEASTEAFVFHDSVIAAIRSGMVNAVVSSGGMAVNLFDVLVAESVDRNQLEYRSTHFVGKYVVKFIVSARRNSPIVEYVIWPIIGHQAFASPLLDHQTLLIDVAGSTRVIRGSKAMPAQGQSLNPVRITVDFDKETVEFDVRKNFQSTSHVVSSGNRTGVGPYFSFDHHAETRTLRYWRDEVDASAAQPMHFVKLDGNILTEEDVPNLMFSGAWAMSRSRGYDTEYWIKHSESEPWHDKGARDQHGSEFVIPDNQHLTFDALCQAYIAHRDPVHGLMVEFKAETYLLVVAPSDDGKGTAGNLPGSGRARARVMKTAMNLWFALSMLASRSGLTKARQAHLIDRRDKVAHRMGARMLTSIADIQEKLSNKGPWMIAGGKDGQPPIYSVQEHALLAGVLSMISKGLIGMGAKVPAEIRGLRWIISEWVLEQFGRCNTAIGEWDDEGDGWAIPYQIDVATGKRSGPTTGGWIFTVEMLAEMNISGLSGPQRAKLDLVRQFILFRPGASDWRAPPFIAQSSA